MGIQNSHGEEQVLQIVNETLRDGYAFLRIHSIELRERDESRDLEYLNRRTAEEGIEFLTIQLPRLGDWLDQVLRGQQVQRVEGFAPFDGLYPCFLRPFWNYFQKKGFKCEDPTTAELVLILRTLLHGCKKLDVPCSPDKVEARLASFKDVESELDGWEPPNTTVMWRAQRLMEDYLELYTPQLNRPKHGPGAVAGGERHNEKWENLTLFESVHSEFPYWEFFFPVRSVDFQRGTRTRARSLQLAAMASEYKAMPRVPEPTARLLLVPKDSRGPRVISCEPKELMYLQQGVADHLVRFIEQNYWTKGHVNFTDQTINRRLAETSSVTREWDTIDLSDASDRVSVSLVTYLVPRRITDKWKALRSTATLLPDGTTISLQKFAPMGSALCFPVEALVFWSLAVAAIENCGVARSEALSFVYVYGDDIIIKRGYTEAVMEALESACLKVNRHKSFIGDDPFRESCGIDALNGYNVTPQRIKKLPPARPSDGSGLTAYATMASKCWSWAPKRARALLDVVEDLVGEIPRVPFVQPFLAVVTPDNHWTLSMYKDAVWDPAQCYYVSRQREIRNRKTRSPISSWCRLQKNLIEGASDCDPSHVVDRQSTQLRRKRLAITYLTMGDQSE